MNMISLSLSNATLGTTQTTPRLILTNLTAGQARPGDTVQAVLSDGPAIQSYAWGSSPGSTEYGTGASLVVPQAAAGGLLYVFVQTQAGPYSTVVFVQEQPVFVSTLRAGPGRIDIETLAALQPQPDLVLSAGAATIIVENA